MMDINGYGDAMSKVVPGTFVPDIAPQTAPQSEPLPDDGSIAGAGGVSFKDTLAGMLTHVNDQMLTAQQKSEDLATGKSNDLEGTVKAVEEAGLSMQMALSVRNKILQAYTEISQMQF
ncbi:MAG TPA: flagellar hook-basal body complex protein FliE [Candidatus Baltobacteraceae bacterium]|nr:flagellar hook-basal body complex protein FliE [Candidatus Baltobacteraceae bacterium]